MLADLLDLVLPGSCVGCARPGTALCALRAPTRPCAPSPLDGLDGRRGHPLRRCGPRRAARLQGARPARPDPAARTAARRGGARVQRCAARCSSRCPRARRRAGHAVATTSSRCARAARAGAVVPALRLTRAVRDSAGLDVAGRSLNLRCAMAALPPRRAAARDRRRRHHHHRDEPIEAARALRGAGWCVGGAAVVAATRDGTPGGPARCSDLPLRLAGLCRRV